MNNRSSFNGTKVIQVAQTSCRHQSLETNNLRGTLRQHRRITSSIHPVPRPLEGKEHSLPKTNDLLAFSSILSTRYPPHSFVSHGLPANQNNSGKSSQLTVQPVLNPPITSSKQLQPESLRTTSASKTTEAVHKQSGSSSKISPSMNQRSSVLDQTKRPSKQIERSNKTKGKKKNCLCCRFSLPCLIIWLLLGLLLAAIIAAIVVGVLVASKTISITSTVLTSTTTSITLTSCSCLCPGEIWTFSSDLLARYTFDGTFADTTNTYNATPLNSPTFLPSGYVNQALSLNSISLQSLSIPYIPLANTSFTFEAWINPTNFSNVEDHSLLGLCPSLSSDQCLYLTLRKFGSNVVLYFGFYNDDCQGNTSLSLSRWMHVAFVFDLSTLTQSIYLNGRLDGSCTASAPFMATQGQVTIGTVPLLIPVTNVNFYQGYIDHVSITGRAKSSCEVLEDATLAACFLFDNANPYADSGPNSLLNSQVSTTIISPGQSGQAISFNGSSFLEMSRFTGLGTSNQSFSIALWVRPRSTLGTLVHVSELVSGTGWCVPFIGIAANGSVVVNLYSGAGVTLMGPSIPVSPVWSHLVQTWSASNGLRLYINSILVASLSSSRSYLASGVSNFVTLANSLAGMGYCLGGAMSSHAPGPLNCDVDMFRVYSRELSMAEITTIYQS